MSNKKEFIKNLIRKGEGVNIEFKRTIDSPQKIARVLVSFANTSGGTLLVGVDDDHRIVGIKSELEELTKLEEACNLFIKKELLLECQRIDLDGNPVLVVTIRESDTKPHVVVTGNGEERIYVRVKDKCIPTRRLTAGSSNSSGKDRQSSRQLDTLFQYLKYKDSVTAKVFRKEINYSEKRTQRLLDQWVDEDILLKRSEKGQDFYSSK